MFVKIGLNTYTLPILIRLWFSGIFFNYAYNLYTAVLVHHLSLTINPFFYYVLHYKLKKYIFKDNNLCLLMVKKLRQCS